MLANDENIKTATQLGDDIQFPYPGVWALWDYLWDASPGEHTLRIEATDFAGKLQPPIDDNPTDGHNPIVEIEVFVE